MTSRGGGPAPPPGPRRPRASPCTGTVLAARGLGRSFGGLRAVDDVDLDLPPASVTGLLGPNGSGKTTLFNLIDGTVRPSSGQAHARGPAGLTARAARPARTPAWPAPTSCPGCSPA